MKMKAVIFDMDGVLVDTEPVQLERNKAYFDARNIKYDEAELLKTVGAHNSLTWEIISKFFPDGTTKDDYLTGLHAHFDNELPDFSKLLNPGVIETLQRIDKAGYKIALASSGSREKIKTVMNQCELADFFTYQISGDMFKKSKPNPEIYLTTATKLGVLPEECLVVEDSNYGIAAGKAAGMYTIAIREDRFPFSQKEADEIVDDITEIMTILEKN